jgi:putative nucleotidyltransferase with HDIG domain
MNLVQLTSDQRLIRIKNSIDKMPSLSTTVTKALEICNLPNPSPNDLNRVISLDPVLTGQVLKLINSAYYSLPNHITSLTRAIIMLGINTVKNLALSTAILGCFKKNQTFQCLPMDLFWEHSICVGVAAKALASHKGVAASLREEYFVAGLLHDLGKVPLSNLAPEEYTQALALARLEQGPLHQAEMTVLSIEHGTVGKLIAEKWQLNKALLETMQFHHDPIRVDAENRDLAVLIALADIYANLYGIGSAGNEFPHSRKISEIMELAAISWSDVQALHETVHQEIGKAQIFLQVSGGN